MNGVEIVNTIYEYGGLISPLWVLAFVIPGLIIAIVGLCTIKYDAVQHILFRLAGIVLLGVLVCGICTSIKTDEIIETKYEVIVSEGVDFVEFMDKYEILDQEGKIYTVREKTK